MTLLKAHVLSQDLSGGSIIDLGLDDDWQDLMQPVSNQMLMEG